MTGEVALHKTFYSDKSAVDFVRLYLKQVSWLPEAMSTERIDALYPLLVGLLTIYACMWLYFL
jgi:hypothetical protein